MSRSISAPSVRRAAVETLEARQMLASQPIGDLPLGKKIDFATGYGTTTYTFHLAQPTTLDAIVAGGNATLLRNGVTMASGATFSRPLLAGNYSLQVAAGSGSALTLKTSTFSPPTRMEAEVWGGGAIHLNWDDNTDAEMYYRIDRWTRLGWRRGQYVPANTTNAVIDNLIPGKATSYRVSAVTATGESLRSANIVSAMTESEDTSGWFQINISGVSKGEAGWDIINSDIGIWPEYRDGSNAHKSKYVYGTSWQSAVWTYSTSLNSAQDAQAALTFNTHRAVEEATEIVAHTFPVSSYFRVNTVGAIKSEVAGNSNNNGGFKVSLDDNTKIIAIEDSSDSIDRDYDDFYWTVSVTKAELDRLVVSGASQEFVEFDAFPTSYLTSRQIGAFAAVEAVLKDGVTASDLVGGPDILSGGNTGADRLTRVIPRDTPSKTTITANIGVSDEMDSVDVWTIGATVEVRTSGTTPSDSVQFGTELDGTETLGPVVYNGGTYAAGKIAAIGTLEPYGVTDILSTINNGLNMNRDAIARHYRDGVKMTGFWFADWTDDTSLAYWKKTTPNAAGEMFDVDGPNCFRILPGTMEANVNFRQYATFDGVRISDYAEWYYEAKVDTTLATPVVKNIVSTGQMTLPPF